MFTPGTGTYGSVADAIDVKPQRSAAAIKVALMTFLHPKTDADHEAEAVYNNVFECLVFEFNFLRVDPRGDFRVGRSRQFELYLFAQGCKACY